MTKVVLDMSMSLDGFIAGTNVGKEYPMGMNGENLHTWIFSTPKDKVDADVEREMFAKTGAVILGNRTFEIGVDLWGRCSFSCAIFCAYPQGARKVNKEKRNLYICNRRHRKCTSTGSSSCRR